MIFPDIFEPKLSFKNVSESHRETDTIPNFLKIHKKSKNRSFNLNLVKHHNHLFVDIL